MREVKALSGTWKVLPAVALVFEWMVYAAMMTAADKIDRTNYMGANAAASTSIHTEVD